MPVAPRPAVARPAVALLALGAAALAACDAAPGLAAEAARPTLAGVTVAPLAVTLGTDAPTAAVPLAVEGVLDGEGPVSVRVLVRYAETDSLVTSVEAAVDPGPFRVEAPVVLPRGATGDYAVRVSTAGADGRAGDQAAAVLRFAAGNLGPPTVTVAPADAVARPTGAATATVPIVATVADPDGRANVAVVVARLPEAEGGGLVRRLYDDGEDADRTAGDGRYTASPIVVTSAFEPGTYVLEVVAFDRAGAASAPAPFSFTVR